MQIDAFNSVDIQENAANVPEEAETRADLQLVGGADNVAVNSLAGTAVSTVNVDLAGTLGGSTGDGQPDAITLNGTAAPDTINITANSGAVDIAGLIPVLHITHPEIANDSLIVNGLGGTDTFNIGPGVTSLITVVTNQ